MALHGHNTHKAKKPVKRGKARKKVTKAKPARKRR